MYNTHPIFVHFPVALLFLYSLIRILPLRRWVPSVAWKDVERILLLVGVGGAFLALATGETAEHLVRPNHQLVETHAFFGSLATWMYGALLLGEIATIVSTRYGARIAQVVWLAQLVRLVEKILTNSAFATALSVVGLIAIATTGMLGGVIAYGTTADPFAPVLLKFLGITL